MKQKMITSFLMVALSHYFLGCALYKTNEVSNAKDLTQSNRVLYLELPSGEKVTFNEKYGDVVYEPGDVTGYTQSGEFVTIPLDDISEVFVVNNPRPLTLEMLQSDTTLRISKISTWRGKTDFDGNGGRYKADNSVIRGITTDGKFYEIPFSKVKLAVMQDLSVVPSIFVSILLIAAGIFGGFYIAVGIVNAFD